MSRPMPYIPPGTTVEITIRTLRGLFLLPATPNFTRIVVGILARAQELYSVKIHFGTMLRNHMHLILTPEDREQLARFMGYVDGVHPKRLFDKDYQGRKARGLPS